METQADYHCRNAIDRGYWKAETTTSCGCNSTKSLSRRMKIVVAEVTATSVHGTRTWMIRFSRMKVKWGHVGEMMTFGSSSRVCSPSLILEWEDDHDVNVEEGSGEERQGGHGADQDKTNCLLALLQSSTMSWDGLQLCQLIVGMYREAADCSLRIDQAKGTFNLHTLIVS